jgi:putative ABC transport system permease protein
MISSSGNVKMALEAIRSARWRSMLTTLGIVIGVVSVVTTVSLGEGIKKGVVNQINDTGADLITIRPGNTVKRDASGNVTNINLLGNINTGTLGEGDLNALREMHSLTTVVPFSYVSSAAITDEQEFDDGVVIGTSHALPEVLNQKVEYGDFFTPEESSRSTAVIGKRVAEQLFHENVPIGRVFSIRGERFVVSGVLEEFDTAPLVSNADYNLAIFIPYEVGKKLNNDQTNIYQILVKPKKVQQTGEAVAAITDTLKNAHQGQTDFTVLKQEDNLAIANDMLNLLTSFVSGIAAISLIVGGIGILNIMLVSVTERTHEIGIRKAVGATNRQILGQFLTEAVILSLAGGLLGVVLSLFTNYLLRVLTELTPVLTWPIMVVAVGVSIVVGVIFGITPALKAARKHPIDALRHE